MSKDEKTERLIISLQEAVIQLQRIAFELRDEVEVLKRQPFVLSARPISDADAEDLRRTWLRVYGGK